MKKAENDQASGKRAFSMGAPGGGGNSGFTSGLRGLSRNQGFSMLIILAGMWLILGLLSPYFFTRDNLLEITLQTAVIAIIAAGETFIIISAGIDLSVGAVFAASAVVGGLVLDATGSLPLALASTVGFGALLGLTNGVLITKLWVPPFIATLGMMGVARGLALILSNGIPIYGLPDAYKFIGQGRLFDIIPVPTVIMIAVFAVGYIIANRSRFGRFIYAIGSNAEAARLSGIKVVRVIIGVYIIGGLLAGLASIIESGRLGIIQPAGGNGYELLAIGAVVIGGTSLFGGEGSIIATLIGAIIMTTLRNGLNILGVNAFWQYVVNGAIIIAAIAIDQYRRRRQQGG
ncbi:MAG: ABC transporter permease [Caldilineales bacterium]|nr:ABC transporter permease [Caldilineales bacterium]